MERGALPRVAEAGLMMLAGLVTITATLLVALSMWQSSPVSAVAAALATYVFAGFLAFGVIITFIVTLDVRALRSASRDAIVEGEPTA